MLVILDRDGVINLDSPHYIKSPAEWQPIDGSLAAIAKLHQAGHVVVVATNQSGVGRGFYSLATLADIHAKMTRMIEVAGGKVRRIYFCPHTPEENCYCRKPKPGMLVQIKKDFPELARTAILVGDSARDIMAAQAAEIAAVLVRTGNGPKAITALPKHIKVYDNLLAFVDQLNEQA